MAGYVPWSSIQCPSNSLQKASSVGSFYASFAMPHIYGATDSARVAKLGSYLVDRVGSGYGITHLLSQMKLPSETVMMIDVVCTANDSGHLGKGFWAFHPDTTIQNSGTSIAAAAPPYHPCRQSLDQLRRRPRRLPQRRRTAQYRPPNQNHRQRQFPNRALALSTQAETLRRQ